MAYWSRITLAVLFLALMPASFCSSASESLSRQERVGKEKTLEDVKKQIREQKQAVRTAEKKEPGVLGELERINRSLSESRSQLRKLEASLKRIDGRIAEANSGIERLERQRRALSSLLASRLRSMYMMKKGEVMDVIFSSVSSEDLGRRHKYLTVIMEHDSELIEKMEENLASLEGQRQSLKTLQADLARDRKEALASSREAQRLQSRKRAFLSDIQKEKSTSQRAVTELEQAAKELSDLVGTLRSEAPAPGSSGFERLKGRLAMPVDGKVVSLYGRVSHPTYKTVTFNNGIVIEARVGSPVKSVYDGRVVYVGWLNGYGQVMIVDHGSGFYTLFAYLSDVLKHKGEAVERGVEIALVGDSGPRASGGLYFEIRQKGVPRDPMAWLADR